jgi:predicted aspartyl protease
MKSRTLEYYLEPKAWRRVACYFFVTMAIPCVGADERIRPDLEDYLKRIGYESIPLRRGESNHLLARGEVNDKARTFLIDTGWSMTTLDKGVGRKLTTLGQLGVTLEDSFLGKVKDPSIALMGLKLGRALFTNQPARVRKLNFGGSAGPDGVLGCDFLFRNHCLIDCLDRRLYVRGAAPGGETRNALQETLRRSGYHEVKLTRELNLVPTCEANANGQPVRLLVDTGSVWSLIDKGQTRRLGLRRLETPVRVVGVGKIGSQWLDVSRVTSLGLGALTLSDVDFGIVDLKRWGLSEPGRKLQDVHGVLGGEQLVFNGALIDCRGLKLWLQPLKAAR